MSYDTTDIEYFSISDFVFAGGSTKNIKVAYRSINADSAKGTVLIPTCYQGRINKTLNFTSGVLKDYHVVVVAMLGNGESSSPSNDADFPTNYSLRYQAVMHGAGTSPFLKHCVVICGSAKTSGLNYAFLEGPASALIASRDYDQGRYKSNGVKPVEGLRAFGRAYAAWVPSAEWFRQELWRESGAESLHEWLHPPMGKDSNEEWDPEDLLVMARMWQAGDVGAIAGDGDYKEALRGVTAKVLLMPSSADQYFLSEDAENEARFLQNGISDPIPTIWGHMAGGEANPVDVN